MEALFGMSSVIYDDLELHDKMRIHNIIIREDVIQRGNKNNNYLSYKIDFGLDILYQLKNMKRKSKFIEKVEKKLSSDRDSEEIENILINIKRIKKKTSLLVLVTVKLPKGKYISYVYEIVKQRRIPYWIEKNRVKTYNPLLDIFNSIPV